MLKTKPVLDMPKKSAMEDWTRHDVLYAVRRTGTTLQQLSLKLGYHRGTLGNALHTPAPKYERLIAEHLKRTVQDVWPTRYHPDGSPKSGRGERGLARRRAKFNDSNGQCNVNLTEGQPA
jgi:Ner family transcriptional regulator